MWNSAFERLSKIRQHSLILMLRQVPFGADNWLGNKIYQNFAGWIVFDAGARRFDFGIITEASRCKIGANDKNIPRWLIQTKDFLHENFTESSTLEEIAKIADVHPVHLSRVFREKFDCTIGEYVRRLRVEFASKQIASTENSLCEIAHAAGFADQSHLNKTFKTVFGSTPAEYRKLSRRR